MPKQAANCRDLQGLHVSFIEVFAINFCEVKIVIKKKLVYLRKNYVNNGVYKPEQSHSGVSKEAFPHTTDVHGYNTRSAKKTKHMSYGIETSGKAELSEQGLSKYGMLYPHK